MSVVLIGAGSPNQSLLNSIIANEKPNEAYTIDKLRIACDRVTKDLQQKADDAEHSMHEFNNMNYALYISEKQKEQNARNANRAFDRHLEYNRRMRLVSKTCTEMESLLNKWPGQSMPLGEAKKRILQFLNCKSSMLMPCALARNVPSKKG